jgi:hypothetical protein
MDKELLTNLIVAFLALNSKPSDAQVHAMAGAVNTDHETIEAIMYEMLADSDEIVDEADTDVVVAAEEGLSEEQEVLDGDYDPNTTSPDDLILNDGAPEGTSSQQENQDSTLNDGVGTDDVGIDINSDQSALVDDGAATKTLRASMRLAATEGYEKGQKVETKVGGRWIKATITGPMNKAGNYPVRFKVGAKTTNYVSSPDQLRPDSDA